MPVCAPLKLSRNFPKVVKSRNIMVLAPSTGSHKPSIIFLYVKSAIVTDTQHSNPKSEHCAALYRVVGGSIRLRPLPYDKISVQLVIGSIKAPGSNRSKQN